MKKNSLAHLDNVCWASSK